ALYEGVNESAKTLSSGYSPPRRGGEGCGINKSREAAEETADGVVGSAKCLGLNSFAELTTPAAPISERIHFIVCASTPPLREGEYSAAFLSNAPLAQSGSLPRRLWYHLSGPWPPDNFSILIDNLATADRCARPAGHFRAGVNGPLCVRQLILVANRALQIGIPDDDVSVGSHLDGPLARVHSKYFCRVCRGDCDELLDSDAASTDALGVQHRAIDLNVADPFPSRDDIERRIQFLFTRTSTMIGSDRMDGSLCNSSPKRVLVALLAERWRTGIEPGIRLEKTLLCQMKIHRTRLDIDRQAASLAVFGD